MIGYQKTISSKDEWLTPPEIIKSLGQFDLDPCAPINRPWDTALNHYTIEDDGLVKNWFGRVWMNPPFSRGVMGLWLNKLCKHGNGILLIPARLDTNDFHNYVFQHADSMLALRGRLNFYHVNGSKASHNSGGPTVLVAYGEHNSDALCKSGLDGAHLPINSIGVILCGFDKTWKWIVKTVLVRVNEGSLKTIYKEVERMAPERVIKNKHYKAKIRQTLQLHFKRTGKAKYKGII